MTTTRHANPLKILYDESRKFFFVESNVLIRKKNILAPLLIAGLFSLGFLGGYSFFEKYRGPRVLGQSIKKNPQIEFIAEVYNKIKDNYWDKISDEALTNLFKLAAEKITNEPFEVKKNNLDGLVLSLTEIYKKTPREKQKELTASLANLVLSNLAPFGRSGLYTHKDETNLKNKVENVNPEKDLYQSLNLPKESSAAAVEKGYRDLTEKLKASEDPEEKKRLAEAEYAYRVLNQKESKESYDKTGAEPTVFTRLLSPEVLYLRIKQFSPITFEEFQNEMNGVKGDDKLTSLIVDIRGNIGGSIDILPYFLGPFIGQNQYAYDFFHQGDYTPLKTKTGFLPSLLRYKKVILLIDGEVQSTGEVLAATFKRYNVGVLIGTKTKGWGTVEKVYRLESQIDPSERYSIFLAHSLTLDTENQPIEGRGVLPTIDVKSPNWEKELLAYYASPELIEKVKVVLEAKSLY